VCVTSVFRSIQLVRKEETKLLSFFFVLFSFLVAFFFLYFSQQFLKWRKDSEGGENCIMRGFLHFPLHRVLLGLRNHGVRDGQNM
jgi:hypothetical protein